MGWYHVNNTGKGINLGDGEEVHYNEDYLAKYAPTKEEVLDLVPSFKNEDLEGYESWPLGMKFVAAAGDWYNLHRAKDYGSDCLKEEAHIIYANALCHVFEKCYGYPSGSFFSTLGCHLKLRCGSLLFYFTGYSDTHAQNPREVPS